MGMELPPGHISHGEVAHVGLIRGPSGGALRCGWRERVSEDRELEAKVAARRGGQVAGDVPPLGAEGRVRTMVWWKVERPRVDGPRVARGVGAGERLDEGHAGLKYLGLVGATTPQQQEQHEDCRRAHHSPLSAKAGRVLAIRHAG